MTPAKKILILSLSYYPNFIGGAEVAIKEITDRIPQSDLEFHMVTLRYDSALPRVSREGNVLVHRIGFSRPHPSMADLKKFPLHYNKLLFQFTAALKASSLHRTEQYDAIWAMMAHSSGVPAALFKLSHPDVPYILTLQEGDPPEYIEKLMRPLWPLFSRAFTTADIVDAESTFLGKWARRRGFSGPLEVIPNAVDTQYFARGVSPDVLASLRRSLGKKEGDIYLITTSRLVRKNAVDDVLSALPLLPESVHFLILGIGPDEDKLRALAKKLGVEKRAHFLGQIAQAELPSYLGISDIFIRPSRSEGMGNSFIEAMAAGLPVIATQEGGIADFLFDARRDPGAAPTGFAVDRDSPEQIARAVERIISNPGEVEEAVRNARDLVFKKYDWNIIARDMREKVFGRALKNHV